MLSRYAVVGVAAPSRGARPRSRRGSGLRSARASGSVTPRPVPSCSARSGFVVVGSLYHVVPFIVWLDRYADRVGLERVPAIDDLYDARVATVDLAATLGGAC